MNRPRRILSRSSAALSLLLFLMTAALWLRAYWVADFVIKMRIRYDDMQRVSFYTIGNCRAGILTKSLHFQNSKGNTVATQSWERYPRGPFCQSIPGDKASPGLSYDATHNATYRKFLGVEFLRRGYDPPNEEVSALLLPHWLLLALTSLMPTRQFIKYRRQRTIVKRQQQNLCIHCGYDLRASKKRCPECGASIERSRQLTSS